MSAKVFRVVVDSYPTPDGKPFTDQPVSFWRQVVDHYYDPFGDDPTPHWVPDISDYLHTESSGDYGHTTWDPPVRRGKSVCDGFEYPPLITVPSLTRKHFFSRHAAQVRVDQLVEWGCVARVETAEIGAWK